jgi:large subunit ribosomal protein L29
MPLKASDLREQELDDLQGRVEELRARLFDLRSRQARKELEGGVEIRIVRRDLARVLTILNERTREQNSTAAPKAETK